MAKRKRGEDGAGAEEPGAKMRKPDLLSTTSRNPSAEQQLYLQIVAGSYERALHGIIATIPRVLLDRAADGKDDTTKDAVSFADSFLFNAHTASIRCLALSPTSTATNSPSQKVILATGSADERINLYHLSPRPPASAPTRPAASLPSLSGGNVSQNPANRELGSLLHHSGPVTALRFPSRSKLLSAASDNTIAVSRTRDWTVLSTIKAPIPKPIGRPSGDTLAPGEVPAGVNDFAVHPTGKLLVSVGKGEKCMRLWNLMTGKKAGVLSFDKDLLAQLGEGRHGTGEGRRVVWDPAGDEFVVGFERAAVLFGMDCKPKARIVPEPRTKVHQMHYIPDAAPNILCLSTEDGRLMFYATADTTAADEAATDPAANGPTPPPSKQVPPQCKLLGQLGGPEMGLASRIKDFDIMSLPPPETSTASGTPSSDRTLLITGSSDGAVRLWLLDPQSLLAPPQRNGAGTHTEPAPVPPARNGERGSEPGPEQAAGTDAPDVAENAGQAEDAGTPPPQVAALLATYETGHRITCLRAFVMTGEPVAAGHDDRTGDFEDERGGGSGKSESESESESDGGDA